MLWFLINIHRINVTLTLRRFFMFNKIITACLTFLLLGCAPSISNKLLSGKLSPSDPQVDNGSLCATYFMMDQSSKESDYFADEIVRRGIDYPQCVRLLINHFGGVDDFCSSYNYAYVKGQTSVYKVNLNLLRSIQKEFNINCNTSRFAQHYFSESQQRARYENMKVWGDAAKQWGRVLGGKL